MVNKRPVIVMDGRYGLRSPRRGVGEYVYRLLTQLAFIPRPYDIQVYGDMSADLDVVRKLSLLHQVELLMTPTFFTWEQIAFPQVLKEATLVHGTANIAPIVHRRPLILTVHDVIEWHRGKEVPGQIRWRHHLSRAYRMNTLKLLARQAHTILTVSEHAKADLEETLRLDPAKIRVTPLAPKYPVDSPVFPKDPYFLVLGALDPRKNLVGALKAFKRAQLPGMTLKVVGVEQQGLSTVRGLIAAEGLTDRVTLTDMVSDDELKELYRHATGFLYLSYYEGFGLPILESLAVGCPLIASDRSVIPEVTGPGGLLVNPDRVEDIARAMEKLAHDPDLQQTLVREGQRHATQYSWKTTALLTHEAYLDALTALHAI